VLHYWGPLFYVYLGISFAYTIKYSVSGSCVKWAVFIGIGKQNSACLYDGRMGDYCTVFARFSEQGRVLALSGWIADNCVMLYVLVLTVW